MHRASRRAFGIFESRQGETLGLPIRLAQARRQRAPPAAHRRQPPGSDARECRLCPLRSLVPDPLPISPSDTAVPEHRSPSPAGHSMTALERRSSLSLALIFAFRMLGLLLVLRVLAVEAHKYPGGDNPALVGLAMGIYGLTQALLQLPLGMASDRFGRKRVILPGLLVFAAGSLLAAQADSLTGLLLGRALQGAGAVSAAVTALLADQTRDAVRTKAMAWVGGSIGLMFALALVAAPALAAHIGLSGLFGLSCAWALAGVAVLLWWVPPEPGRQGQALRGRMAAGLAEVWTHPDLLRLNLGVFVLHTVQLSMWVAVPPLLLQARLGRLAVSGAPPTLWLLGPLMWVFFCGFNALEASQPSLVSRMAPAHLRGAALGSYNTLQSLGLFAGGALGGALVKWSGAPGLFAVTSALTALWLVLTWPLRPVGRNGH